MKSRFHFATLVLLLLGVAGFSFQGFAYEDKIHFSKTFNGERSYRIYYPKDYASATKSYPVIYFFHGWGGRHFMDPSANLDYERIDSLVQAHDAILVMWDGRVTESVQRPYNVGDHEHVRFEVQFKDYFPEFVAHIDQTYRTLPERGQRSLIGFSMGGFMSYYLAGKFPGLVASAVSISGSPEFYVGYPDNHTLYPIRHTMANLQGLRLRFHNNEEDQLVHLNAEVKEAALREKDNHFEYKVYPGGHKVDFPGQIKGFSEAFNFCLEAFAQPLAQPTHWSHADLYPVFEKWGYRVESTLQEPGFICLDQVSKAGFGVQTKKWLPDGRVIPGVTLQVTTAPIYRPNTSYAIRIRNLSQGSQSSHRLRSDGEGRLTVHLNHERHRLTVAGPDVAPEPVLLDFALLHDGKFLQPGQEEGLRIRLWNGGKQALRGIRLSFSSPDNDVAILNPEAEIKRLAPGKTAWMPPVRVVSRQRPPVDGRPHTARLHVHLTDGQGKGFTQALDVPVFYEVPLFAGVEVDDGRAVAGAQQIFGSGNGNGIPEPGESVMVYVNGQRARLYADDPYLVRAAENVHYEILPAIWPDGFAVSSIVRISENCPPGHAFQFLAHYETREHHPIRRIVQWGKVRLQVPEQKVQH